MRVLVSFIIGALTGAWVTQNYMVPPVEDIVQDAKEDVMDVIEMIEPLLPPAKDDENEE